MTDFKFKTYRCEWQIQFITVDQYEQVTGVYRTIPFPTLEEATAARPEYAEPHQWVKSRWVPKDRTSDYQEVEINYKEVLVTE